MHCMFRIMRRISVIVSQLCTLTAVAYCQMPEKYFEYYRNSKQVNQSEDLLYASKLGQNSTCFSHNSPTVHHVVIQALYSIHLQ